MAIMIMPIPGVPAIRPGDDLGAVLAKALDDSRFGVRDGDVLVVCQKVVSKAEGRVVSLDSVSPSAKAIAYAEEYEKDPRLVELVLRESTEILRMENGHMIVATGPGWVCANAGIDQSNAIEEGSVTLLPVDADESARRLRGHLENTFDARLAVIITDTFGRPWRQGQVEFALGLDGLDAVEDLGGASDLIGRELGVTQIASADQLASAAGLAMGKSDGTPAILIRGWQPAPNAAEPDPDLPSGGRRLIRPREFDLFR